MNELLSKISSYNIFNYLFPGAVVVLSAQAMDVLTLPKLDVISLLLIYYAAGLTVSRIGSLVLEPLLRAARLVQYGDYGKYVAASQKDKKIEVLVEQSNTYRTIAGGIFCLLMVWPVKWAVVRSGLSDVWATNLLLFGGLALFVLSYRKQSDYVRKRVDHHTTPTVITSSSGLP